MFLKKLGLLPVLLVTLLCANNAQAVTINGKEFTKILTLNSQNDFGYWTKGLKYFTFQGNNDYVKPNNVTKAYADNSLAGVVFSQVLAMGTFANKNVTNTALNTGSVTIYGPGNKVLLTAVYTEAGHLTSNGSVGRNGELDVKGIYKVTGGSLFSSSLLTGNLFIDISFDNVWRNNSSAGDLRANLGTFTFYKQVCGASGCGGTTTGGTSGGTQIPEPASVTLLGASLLGFAKRRARK